MNYKPAQYKDLIPIYFHQSYFEALTSEISSNSSAQLILISRHEASKSTLLKMLCDLCASRG